MRDVATAPFLDPSDRFDPRHNGPSPADVAEMVAAIGCRSLDELIAQVVPGDIRLKHPLELPPARGEQQAIDDLWAIAALNRPMRSLIGMGYHDCITPPVILRNVLENPGWYTQYTPYQAEISQGRLEALINFQTMICDLTGLPLANASLLDEATAAAEAMYMCRAAASEDGRRRAFFVAADCHPQTIGVVRTRARALGIEVRVGDAEKADFSVGDAFGVLVQNPATDGRVWDCSSVIERAHASGALAVVATDPLSLLILRPPGEYGADIAVGSTQRFGVPMGGGGPHAAFLATRDEFKRQMPGRLIGVSRDAQGRPAYRLAIQTREQHIRREKATSNICTAQVLLAIIASMYAVYHGPTGLRRIAERVHGFARALAAGLRRAGHVVVHDTFFDTLRIRTGGPVSDSLRAARQAGFNLRDFGDGTLGISLDERSTRDEVASLLTCLGGGAVKPAEIDGLTGGTPPEPAAPHARRSGYLTHPVFNSFHSETEMLRYLFRLQSRDLSLTHSMIPLGSCTMKLNATSEMIPVTWPAFSRIHPFAPLDQQQGYLRLADQLEQWLSAITGLPAVSLQPNAGSQGEYTGMLVIRAYHESRGQSHRDVCLIPTSAHGTNPASAVIAGLRVVAVACDARGNIDLADLKAKSEQHAERLAAVMITYPSTHGVFEEGIREACDIVHRAGGQVYMDGANMNAQVGLCRPGDFGADVCHLNLHKTFCIPHGGGGPGMGPIAAAAHLAPFLPGHPVVDPFARGSGGTRSDALGSRAIGPVSAAPFGSPSILPISWMYIAMMGPAGLTRATQVAILNANYMAKRLELHYPVLYTGKTGRVAHEFIIDCRPFDKSAGITVEDIAKRLIDYGFHAPTMSWPVAGTLMIEPTESESKAELDRFCDALIAIREEIRAIEEGRADRQDNVLKNAPHTAAVVSSDRWTHPYSREQAAYPAPWLREHKFWPAVGRVDNVWGDRHLFCTCPPMEALADAPAAGAS